MVSSSGGENRRHRRTRVTFFVGDAALPTDIPSAGKDGTFLIVQLTKNILSQDSSSQLSVEQLTAEDILSYDSQHSQVSVEVQQPSSQENGGVCRLRPLPSEIEAFVRGRLFGEWLVHSFHLKLNLPTSVYEKPRTLNCVASARFVKTHQLGPGESKYNTYNFHLEKLELLYAKFCPQDLCWEASDQDPRRGSPQPCLSRPSWSGWTVSAPACCLENPTWSEEEARRLANTTLSCSPPCGRA